MERTSRAAERIRIRIRLHLMPPPVEPAQAPMKVSTTSSILENSGHRS